MRAIGVRELRTSAATTIRRAGAGERIIVTVGGRPVAQLGPVEAEHSVVSLPDLVAAGLLVAPRRGGTPSAPAEPVPAWAGARLDRLLRDLRG